MGVTRLTLTLTHERHVRQRGVPATVVPFALGAPARMPAHLLGVLRERLSRVALPAPVEAILLASEATSPLPGRNLGLLPGDEAAAVEVPLVDRLRARLGEDAVVRVAPHAEHRPEQAAHDIAVSAQAPRAPSSIPPGRGPQKCPQPLPARCPKRRVRYGCWRNRSRSRIASKRSHGSMRDGPERIESGWWDGADVRRDYFVAETPRGEVMWIYRDHRYGVDDGEWFLHGVFA